MVGISKTVRIEWMCTRCGQKITRPASAGRPAPGTCSRSPNKGPHRWVQNKKF